ncbi:MAG TPA: effector-associated domain EAD1-containing protein [Pyrinomonadaceae bacterium]|nr:effector-associated domain EAD1-containing protein [Pyrinomonadaceae bacterium]
MIRLTPDQYERLTDALGEAFDLAGLDQLLEFRLGKKLYWESGGTSGKEMVYKLIGTAQRDRWLHKLIEAAVSKNRTPALEQIANELQPAIRAATRDHFNVTFVDNNLALVNRTELRKFLKQLADIQPTGGRILVVNGPPSSGKTYSIELISYLNRALRNFNFVLIDLQKMPGEIRPKHIAESIVSQMSLERTVVPDEDQEQDSRWNLLFCNYLQAALRNAAEPWWIVIDGFNHARLSPAVNDLVKELSGRIRLTLREHRLVLLSYPESLSPEVERVALRETLTHISQQDLISFFGQVYFESNQTYFPKDIAERIGEVFRAVDPASPQYMEKLSTEVVKVANSITA